MVINLVSDLFHRVKMDVFEPVVLLDVGQDEQLVDQPTSHLMYLWTDMSNLVGELCLSIGLM
jgi:hypothetical protein